MMKMKLVRTNRQSTMTRRGPVPAISIGSMFSAIDYNALIYLDANAPCYEINNGSRKRAQVLTKKKK